MNVVTVVINVVCGTNVIIIPANPLYSVTQKFEWIYKSGLDFIFELSPWSTNVPDCPIESYIVN